jgi:hypothetical protein
MSRHTIEEILEYSWTKESVEQFASQCYDRKALMTALISYARHFMTHRILLRLKSGSFRPFALQDWPSHVDEKAKTSRLRKLSLPAATSPRIKKALAEGYPVAAPVEAFGFERILQFLGEEIDAELMCQPVTVGPITEWVLIGKPIRIDPNSESFSTDAITLKFWELEEVCDRIGAQYQRIRRLDKRDQLPAPDERIPPLSGEQSDSVAGDGGGQEGLAPVEVNKQTQQRINADAGGFSADRFLAGEDAFSGERAGPDSAARPLDTQGADDDEDVGVTTGVFQVMVDPRSLAELNFQGDEHDQADEAPALADIEHTAGIELDESVLSDAKKAYHESIEREERQKRRERDKVRQRSQSQAGDQRADRPVSAQDRANVKKAIAVMDSADRDQAFKAARFIASFGRKSLKTLGRLFPGRLFVDRYQYQVNDLPAVERHSPVLCALVELGEPAVQVARHYLDDTSNDLRFYATYLYTRLQAAEDLEPLSARLFDRDRQTRALAQRIIVGLREAAGFDQIVLQPLRAELKQPTDEFRQAIAVEVLGRCRDISSIDALISILKFKSGRLAQLAHEALRNITLQDYSASAVTWDQWWQNQRPDYADQWLVAALDSDSEEIRHRAWREVNRLRGIDVDYHPNYARGQRQQAQRDLAVWLGVTDF